MNYKRKSLVIILFTIYLLLFLLSTLNGNEGGLKEQIIHSLTSKGIHPFFAVVIVSMLPVFELRGGIPIGINLFGLPWFIVVPLALLGNMIPVFPLLLFLGPFSRFLSRFKFFKVFFDWLFKHTRSRSIVVEKYKSIGLMLFVSIPLPVTGAWTGSIAAFLFDIKFHNALISIFSGVIIAAVIVTTLSLLGIWGAIIAGIALIALGIFSLLRNVR